MTDISKLIAPFTFTPKHNPRAYVNSAVRFHMQYSREDRLAAALEAGWNVFQFPAEMTRIDLLSDSGTTTPTIEQLAASLLGDEAYGTNWGYKQLLEQFEKTFGISLLGKDAGWDIYLFHQCRAAEHALFTQIGKGTTFYQRFRTAFAYLTQKRWWSGLVIPSNGHFDTTHANIEANGIEALDIVSKVHPHFRGNMDITALDRLLKDKSEDIPLVYCTITNNTMAGQPVSLENMTSIAARCATNHKPFFLDACRFAENSWFIKQYEHPELSIEEIIHKVFALCDGFTISLKKDGLANMGGALCVRKNSPLFDSYPNILEDLRDHQICTEGHPSYGGMSGRDMMINTTGLKVVTTEAYLDSRIGQIRRFGEYLDELMPGTVIKPFGGHAVYTDIDKFFEGTDMKREDFGGISLSGLLLLDGPRVCELGAFAMGHYDKRTGKEVSPPFNYMRMAIPRLKYEEQDMCFFGDCLKNLYDKRDIIPRAVPVYAREKALRHFKARFELVSR